MGQKEISALTPASSLVGTDLMEIETAGGASRKAALEVLQDLLFPPGFIADFGNTSAPTGWLECDGTAVSRSLYARLFAAIGETWGAGNGTTTFNLPDLRGAFRRGTGSHDSETMVDSNPFAGPSVGLFENDQILVHEHKIGHHDDTPSTFAGIRKANSSGGVDIYTGEPLNMDESATRQGDETRPFAAGVLVCIKI